MSDKSRPIDILVFGAHPDDAEIGMGGTIAKHAAHGLRIAICDLTDAEMSSNGDVHTRQEEAKKPARCSAVVARSNLAPSGPRAGATRGARGADYYWKSRRPRPRIVFAPYWHDRHPDHVACSRLVQEAVFNAKLRKLSAGVRRGRWSMLFFYYINDTGSSGYRRRCVRALRTKTKMRLLAYRISSCRGNGSAVQTPLNQGYIEHVEARDRVMGQTASGSVMPKDSQRRSVFARTFVVGRKDGRQTFAWNVASTLQTAGGT